MKDTIITMSIGTIVGAWDVAALDLSLFSCTAVPLLAIVGVFAHDEWERRHKRSRRGL